MVTTRGSKKTNSSKRKKSSKSFLTKKQRDKIVRVLISIVVLLLFTVIMYYLDSDSSGNDYPEGQPTTSVSQDPIIPEQGNEPDSGESIIGLDGEILNVYMWNVGQGDGTLFVQGDVTMLIDCGSSDKENVLINDIKDLGITEIDYFIGTHPHEDHMGELYDVLKNFKIKTMYIPYTPDVTSKYYSKAMQEAVDQEITIINPSVGDTLSFGKANVLFLGPSSESYSNDNNYSIAMKISFGEMDFFFSGDAESLAEKEIIDTGYDLDCEVMKAGHHGSDTSNTDAILDAVTPDIVLISVGIANKHEHPIDSVLQRYEERGINLHRTDECGDIILSTDGSNLKFECGVGDYKTYEEIKKENGK